MSDICVSFKEGGGELGIEFSDNYRPGGWALMDRASVGAQAKALRGVNGGERELINGEKSTGARDL